MTDVLGANCTATCPTKNHATFGQCMRSKGVTALGFESTRSDASRPVSHLDVEES